MELYNKEFVYFDWDDKLEGKKGFFSDSINVLKQYVKYNKTSFYGEIFKNSDSDSAYPFEIIDESDWHRGFKFFYYDPYYEYRRAYLEGKQLQFKNMNGNWEDVRDEPLFKVDEYRIKSEIKMLYIILDDSGIHCTHEKKGDIVLFEGTAKECIKWIEKYKKFEKIMLAWKQGKTIQYKKDNDELDEWTDWQLTQIPHDTAFDYWKEWRIKDECEEVVESVPFNSVQELIDAWDNKYPQNKNRPEGIMPLIWIKNKEKNRVYLITDFLFEKAYNCDVGTEEENLKLKELFENYTFADGSIIGKVKE